MTMNKVFGFYFYIFLVQKLKISCFRNEEFAAETPKKEFIEHYLPEELVKSENDNSSAVKRDWGSTLREVYTIFFFFCFNSFVYYR